MNYIGKKKKKKSKKEKTILVFQDGILFEQKGSVIRFLDTRSIAKKSTIVKG